MTLQMIQEFVGGAISERKRTVTPHSSLSGGRRERLLLTVLRFFNIFLCQRHQVFLGDGGEGGQPVRRAGKRIQKQKKILKPCGFRIFF